MPSENNKSTYYIIYPGGDRGKVKVLELSWSMSHELGDYALASRQSFIDAGPARLYARSLAREHGLQYVPDEDEPDYLD